MAFEAQNRENRLQPLFANGPLELYCGVDQVGTLKILSDRQGRPIKIIERDSFGARLFDSLPDLQLPIGFAGGLEDHYTELVHFGYRDYYPYIGRFTAPDPLGDTGGDHDLYDYCIDDPVSMNDPMGLFPPALLILGGIAAVKALGLAGGLAGAHLMGRGVDLSNKINGRDAPSAADAVEKVSGKTAGLSAISGLGGGATVLAPTGVVHAGRAMAPVIARTPVLVKAGAKEVVTKGGTLIGAAQDKISKGVETARKAGSKVWEEATVVSRNAVNRLQETVDKVQKTVKNLPYSKAGQQGSKAGEFAAGVVDPNAPVGGASFYTQAGTATTQGYAYFKENENELQTKGEKLVNELKKISQKEKGKQLQEDKLKSTRRRWR